MSIDEVIQQFPSHSRPNQAFLEFAGRSPDASVSALMRIFLRMEP